jgi:glutathione peroxidase
MPSLQSIPLTTLSGSQTTLAEYAGKVLLIVNTASKCGLTPQYTALESLYAEYKDRGLVVLGFPANDFAGQEPGSDQEIAKFCSLDYPVSFPMFSKITVVGPNKHPLFAELIAEQPTREEEGSTLKGHLAEYASANGFPPPNELPELVWNFEKFLIGKDGKVIARFVPDITPDDPRIKAAIEAAL